MSSPRPTKLPTARPSRPAFGAPVRSAPTSAPEPVAALDSEPAAPVIEARVFVPDTVALEKAQARGDKALLKAQQRARERALHAVHVLPLLTPGVLVAMSALGPEEEQPQRFVDWMAQVRERAAAWLERWDVAPEDKPWVLAALERVVAEHPELETPARFDAVMAAALEHAPPPFSPVLPASVAAPLALLQALAPVQRVQAAFGLGRPHVEEDLEMATRLLAEAGQDAVAELVDPVAPEEVRVVVFVGAVVAAGKTLAQLWMSHGHHVQLQARGRTRTEQEAWEQAHPDGEDLRPVFSAFQQHASRLRRLARLARPRP